MTKSEQIAEPPTTLEEWQERHKGIQWTPLLLKWHPPRWMACMTQDGTILFGWISGIRTQWPTIVIEVHGSQLRCEVSFETLLGCLQGGRPVRI